MVLAGEGLITARLGTDEGSLLAVSSDMGFETAWSVEALAAAVKGADIVPLATGLAVCP